MTTKSAFRPHYAPTSPFSVPLGPMTMILDCESLPFAAISAQQAGHPVDVGSKHSRHRIMNRRRFVTHLLALGSVFSLSWPFERSARRGISNAHDNCSQPIWLRKIAQRYHGIRHKHNSMPHSLHGFDAATFSKRVRDDFDDKRIIIIDGWVFAESECEYCLSMANL